MKRFGVLAALLLVGAIVAPLEAGAQVQPVTTADDLILRYEYQGRVAYGRVDGTVVRELPGTDIFTAASNTPTGRSYPLESVRILTPVDPDGVQKVLGVSLNTRRPGRSNPVPHPRWFTKFPTSLAAHEATVEFPREARGLSYAGGLVVIIGREGKNITVGEAPDYVWGVTVGNDFSDIGWVGERGGVGEPGRVPGKATDGWSPIGPYVARGIDFSALPVETRLNGEVVQSGTTLDLVNDIPGLIANISRYITLKPGDLIFTGTMPYREGARRVLQTGDELEVEIPGIGVLRNRVVTQSTAPGGGS